MNCHIIYTLKFAVEVKSFKNFINKIFRYNRSIHKEIYAIDDMIRYKREFVISSSL